MGIDGTWRGPTQGHPHAGIANIRFRCSGKQLKGEMVISDFQSGKITAQLSGELGVDNRFEAVLESFRITTTLSVPRTGSLEGNYDPLTPLILGEWKTDTGAYGTLFLVPCPNVACDGAHTVIVDDK